MKKSNYGKSSRFSRSIKNSKFNDVSIYILLGVLVLSSLLFIFISQRYNMSYEPFENAIKTRRIEYYYKEDCPHCVSFKPTWEKVSTDPELTKIVDFKSYDIKNDNGKSVKYGINSIPEVIAVDIDTDNKKNIFESNTRSIEDLTTFVKNNK